MRQPSSRLTLPRLEEETFETDAPGSAFDLRKVQQRQQTARLRGDVPSVNRDISDSGFYGVNASTITLGVSTTVPF
jgi:hypothetical protein